jgi:hypothetical protein
MAAPAPTAADPDSHDRQHKDGVEVWTRTSTRPEPDLANGGRARDETRALPVWDVLRYRTSCRGRLYVDCILTPMVGVLGL